MLDLCIPSCTWAIPHKRIPSDWLPPFIADALNKVIGYTTKMTQRKSRYISVESLYCEPSLQLICLKIQYADQKLQGIVLHKVGEAMLPILSECIYYPYLTDVRLYIAWMLWSQPCIMPDLGVPGRGRGRLGWCVSNCNVPQTTYVNRGPHHKYLHIN